MLCSIQDTLQIDLPDQHKDVVTAYNTEWDKANGQGWELKNFIELTKDRKSLFDIGGNIGFFSWAFCLNNNVDNKKSIIYPQEVITQRIAQTPINYLLQINDIDIDEPKSKLMGRE